MGFLCFFGERMEKCLRLLELCSANLCNLFFFLSANSKPISLGVSTAKLSQSDLHDLRLFFTFDEAETAGAACV